MTFFSLISTAISSIFYGLVVTAVIMALLYVVLKAISRNIVRTPVFYITGIVLAILLLIQTSLMIGAFQAKDAADSAEIYVSQLLENSFGTVGAQDSQRVLDAITEEFPIIGTDLGLADFSGHDVSDLAESMHETMISYLNSYIWHRIWWILGFIFVACLVVVLFENSKQNNRNHTRRRVSVSEPPHHRRRIH